MKNTLILCLLALFIGHNGSGQARQSVHLGIAGSYFSSDGAFNGCGNVTNAGWQKMLKNPKVRLTAGLAYGSYDNSCVEDAPDADFTTLSARAIFNYDFVQTDRFAAFIGGGPQLNTTFGEVLSPGLTDPDLPLTRTYPYDKNGFHPGLAFNIGLRFYGPNARLGLEIVPINVQIGVGEYSEIFILGRLFYSIDSRRNPTARKR